VTFEVQATSRPDREPPIRLTVGLGLIKASGFELAVQKLTEIGVARIVPLETERSVVTYRESRDWEKRAGRLARIVIEAAEQSERVTLPEIAAPTSLADFLSAASPVVLVERGSGMPLAGVEIRSEMAIAVGPEGGWSPDELELIQSSADATAASIGGLIYRAETAAIVAAGTLIQQAIAQGD
jgi:16S rRNA (uracil1498-N3)-methyltransferase